MICVVRSTTKAHIIADSKWAIDTFRLVQACPNPIAHHFRDNFDLIAMLCHLFQDKDPSCFSVEKIKSHLSDDQSKNYLDGYKILGNRMADQTAKAASSEKTSPLIALAWEIGRWYSSRKQMLRQFLEFLTLADQTRRDAMNKPQDKSVASGSIRFDDLLVWKPVAMVRELPAEVSMEFMKGFLPGPFILQHIFCWAKQLMWPPEPDPSCIGISVFELAINSTISTGINMPRVIRGTGNTLGTLILGYNLTHY